MPGGSSRVRLAARGCEEAAAEIVGFDEYGNASIQRM
jgi:hypothetical protein